MKTNDSRKAYTGVWYISRGSKAYRNIWANSLADAFAYTRNGETPDMVLCPDTNKQFVMASLVGVPVQVNA